MICSIIKRRVEKVDLGQEYKQRFLKTLYKVQQKQKSQSMNKSLIIKKICQKYLKICNKLITSSNIQESLTALQFIKLLQLDIYEGKSYELYPIKITSHLLYVKCFDIKIQQKKTTIESDDFRKKKRLYIERLKMFVQEIQQSFFNDFLQKDYYSNLDLILFLIIKNDMEKLLENNHTYLTTTESILVDIQLIKTYVAKLFELLKSHILQLNEMLFYLENKVYQLLNVKVKLMIQLFQIQATLHFIQHVGERFSDHQWSIYKKFLQEDKKHQTKPNTTKKTIKNILENVKKSQIQPPKTFQKIVQKFSIEEESLTDIQGGNYKNLAYETIKTKFFSDQVDFLWQKYDGVFNKIPNSIDQEQIFERVYVIFNSFKEKSRFKSKRVFTNKSLCNKINSKKTGENDSDEESKESGSTDEIKNESKLSVQRHENLEQFRGNKNESIYKREKNTQLNDFMSFVKQSNQKSHQRENYFSDNGKQQQVNLASEKNEQPSEKLIHPPLNASFLKVSSQIPSNKDITESSNDDQKEEESESSSQKALELIPEKHNESMKRSNFKMIKDMKNIFEFICQKKKQNPPEENLFKSKTQNKMQLKSLLKNGKEFFEKIDQNFKSEGLRKLTSVKTPTIKLLENMKENQFERLRRIKSTDIFASRKTEISVIASKNSKPEIYKNRSKTLYFPFIKQGPKLQVSHVFDLPKMNSTDSKLFIFSNGQIGSQNKKGPLKIKKRSPCKKTTLDIMEFDKLQSRNEEEMKRPVELNEFKVQNDKRKMIWNSSDENQKNSESPKTYMEIGDEQSGKMKQSGNQIQFHEILSSI